MKYAKTLFCKAGFSFTGLEMSSFQRMFVRSVATCNANPKSFRNITVLFSKSLNPVSKIFLNVLFYFFIYSLIYYFLSIYILSKVFGPFKIISRMSSRSISRGQLPGPFVSRT